MANLFNHSYRLIKSALRSFFWAISKPGFRLQKTLNYFLLTNPEARINVTNIRGKLTFDSDGLATMHNASFMEEPKFKAAYAAGKATESWGKGDPAWRAYLCCWAAEQAKHLPGDFVECGVNRGGISRVIADYINFASTDKTFYLLDTYGGLDESLMTETELKTKDPTIGGRYQDCYEDVKATFSDINAKVIKGVVPDTLTQVDTDKVCYLSIDMNCAAPEIAAAEFFWDKLVPGAVVVLDDYAWISCLPQKEAFDEFAKRKNIPILCLPTGQGLFFKPVQSTNISGSETTANKQDLVLS